MSIKYIAELEGLRGVSILLVFLSHAWLGHVIPGGLGVTIFFFISGYIITELLIREYNEFGKINILDFYLKRISRLMPALLVYLFFSAALQLSTGSVVVWIELTSAVLYFANYYGIFIGYSNEQFISPYGIVWSLSVEEHFYMVYPLLCSFFFARQKKFLVILITAVVAALMWRSYLVYDLGLDQLSHYRIYKATDTRFDSIVYGVLFSVLSRNIKFVRVVSSGHALVVGFSLLVLSLLITDPAYRETLRYSMQGLALMLVFQHLLFKSDVLMAILRFKFILFFGKISYSLYLYHWLVFVVIEHYFKMGPIWFKLILMIPISIIFATISFYYVERPGLRYGAKLRARLPG